RPRIVGRRVLRAREDQLGRTQRLGREHAHVAPVCLPTGVVRLLLNGGRVAAGLAARLSGIGVLVAAVAWRVRLRGQADVAGGRVAESAIADECVASGAVAESFVVVGGLGLLP